MLARFSRFSSASSRGLTTITSIKGREVIDSRGVRFFATWAALRGSRKCGRTSHTPPLLRRFPAAEPDR